MLNFLIKDYHASPQHRNRLIAPQSQANFEHLFVWQNLLDIVNTHD